MLIPKWNSLLFLPNLQETCAELLEPWAGPWAVGHCRACAPLAWQRFQRPASLAPVLPSSYFHLLSMVGWWGSGDLPTSLLFDIATFTIVLCLVKTVLRVGSLAPVQSSGLCGVAAGRWSVLKRKMMGRWSFSSCRVCAEERRELVDESGALGDGQSGAADATSLLIVLSRESGN